MTDYLLRARAISKYFGGLKALSNVDFNVEKGSIFSIIGPNGAGKTTLFNLISGFDRNYEGEIIFNNEEISHCQPHMISMKGLARTFQNVRLFKNLTALENVKLGCHGWISPKYGRAIFGLNASRREERIMESFAKSMLAYVGLEGKENSEVESLALGEQKLLEIGRALASKPKLLLLDEPGAGLNDREMDDLQTIIFKTKEKNITQIIVEHNMKLIMSISNQIMVLNFGTKIAEGDPKSIVSNEKVIDVYLGRNKEFA